MKLQIVNTNDFWSILCDYRSYRSDLYKAYIGNTMFITLVPPEKIKGFLDKKIRTIRNDLRLDEL